MTALRSVFKRAGGGGFPGLGVTAELEDDAATAVAVAVVVLLVVVVVSVVAVLALLLPPLTTTELAEVLPFALGVVGDNGSLVDETDETDEPSFVDEDNDDDGNRSTPTSVSAAGVFSSLSPSPA